MEKENLASVIRKILLNAGKPMLNKEIAVEVFERTGETPGYTAIRQACHILRVRNEDPDRTLLSDVNKGYWYSSDDQDEVPQSIQALDERLKSIKEARDAMLANWRRRIEVKPRYEKAKIYEQWNNLFLI